MALTNTQNHLIRAAQIARHKPTLAPSTHSIAQVPTPLYLVVKEPPMIVPGWQEKAINSTVLALDAARLPLTIAKRELGWLPGDYLVPEIRSGQSLTLTRSEAETEIQIDPMGRVRLPKWIRERLFLTAQDTLFLEIVKTDGVEQVNIYSTRLVAVALTQFLSGVTK
jgi:hypothetical protein